VETKNVIVVIKLMRVLHPFSHIIIKSLVFGAGKLDSL